MKDKEIYKKSAELFNNECAICHSNQIAMHHVRYGSCGRHTYMGNVIPLCPRCHALVHTNKKKYQPIIIEMLNRRIENG